MASIAAPAAQPGTERHRLLSLGAISVAAVAAGVATAMSYGRSPFGDPSALAILRGLLVVAYAAVGVYNVWRRPESRFGAYLIAAALAYPVVSLTALDDELAHTIGRVASAAFVVGLAYVFLCFPYDRLGSRLERRAIAWLAGASAAVWLVALPVVDELPAAGPLIDCGAECPGNAFQLVTVPDGVSSALAMATNAATGIGVAVVAVLLYRKARAPGRLRRRLIVPLLACSCALAANYAAYTVLRQAGAEGDGMTALRVAGAATAVVIPLAMLLGQIAGRVFVVTSLGQLVARIGAGTVTPARIEALLREALGDPLLRLATWEPARVGYVDVDGEPVALPPPGRAARAVTFVDRSGRPVAVLVHDAALDLSSGVAEGLAATALLLLDNTGLAAELRESRARIVASAQAERLRLERNLHDGAQQRLFGMQLKLRSARARAGDEQLARELEELGEDVAAVVEELRTLAHGIYPTVLRERGLGDALRAFARTAVVPLTVVDRSGARCSATVEEAIYFSALEAVQNASKHGGPGVRVTITLERSGADLEFAIVDDGDGFEPGGGSEGMGLLSMRDRIGAVGGDLVVVSRPGGGTSVEGVVHGCFHG